MFISVPAGETLTYCYTTEENGWVLRRYWTNVSVIDGNRIYRIQRWTPPARPAPTRGATQNAHSCWSAQLP
jgi:hypothetical protein